MYTTVIKRTITMSLLSLLVACQAKQDEQRNVETCSGKEYLTDWKPGYLDIHQIATGRGNSAFLILPDGTTLLVDAGDFGHERIAGITDPTPSADKTPAEWITRYIQHFSTPLRNDGDLDYALVTHIHTDHVGYGDSTAMILPGLSYKLQGLSHVARLLNIGTLIDRDFPNYDNPSAERIDNLISVPNYKKFIAARTAAGGHTEKIKVGSNSQIRLLKHPEAYPNFEVRNVVGNCEVWTGKGEETVMIDSVRYDENDWSAGIRISYGKFSWLSTGDVMNRLIEEAIGQACGVTDAIVCNHHANTGMCEGLLRTIKPQVYVLGVWDDDHPRVHILENMLNKEFYPEDRLIFATDMIDENRERMGKNANAFQPLGHIVIRVFDNGERFQVLVLDSHSTDYNVIYKTSIMQSNQ